MDTWATRIHGPVAVIGDVHGQIDKLDAVLDQLEALPDFQQRWIVFIGDLIDRGNDSKSVVDTVLDLREAHPRTAAIAGNHEFAMSAALGLIPVPDFSNLAESWLDHYGAEATFDSYGAVFGDLDDLGRRLPRDHRELFARLPWCVEHPDYLFVHAGLDPNAPYDMQLRVLRQKDATLTRPQWLYAKSWVDGDPPADCRLTVVSGHVCRPQVVIRERRILIDTTGGVQGDLSCVLLPENRLLTSGASAAPVVESTPGGWWQFWKSA